jgi:hypothetical protein
LWMCVVVQENDTFSEHLELFVLDRPPKLGPWCHELCQQSCLTTL